MQKVNLFIFVCLLSGCSLLENSEPLPLYTLKGKPFESRDQLSVSLAIETPLSEASLNTPRIAVTPSPYQRDYLAEGEWPDKLPKIFQEALFESLTQRWGGKYVNRLSASLQTKYVLSTEIQDFSVYHLDQSLPEVHLKVVFKLIDLPNRQVMAAHTFSEITQASALRMDTIVEAFNQGFHCLLTKAIPWMEDVFLKENIHARKTKRLGKDH
ncbi:MAG: ABC-type transport auxiliary lipoprotein family protein [Alphaproteobacteria bacterium]|nr:ABC-type transport auxiliary lipoprotein family protein [Alphaproteobacteria bacterium]